MKRIHYHLATLCMLLFSWQAIVMTFKLPDYILPAPTQVFATLFNQKAIIFQAALPTLYETLSGFMLGILFGAFAAIVISIFKPLARWCMPILVISQAIPTFAIAPILVIWFGFGMGSKVVTTILMIFFPILSALYDGLEKTNKDWLDLAHNMNASKISTYLQLRLPAALPSLASGIRIAAVAAPIGAIAGEWVGASQGLGYLMLNANARMQIDMMFAVLLVIICLSLGLYFGTDRLLRRFIWW